MLPQGPPSFRNLKDNTIHITSVISSPEIVHHSQYSELSKFYIILQSNSSEPPPFIHEPETEIFFTGHLIASLFGSYPVIKVGAGKWVFHRGQHYELVEEFSKARVWGSGYVTQVKHNRSAPRRSYLTVLDPTPTSGACIRLLAWDSEILGQMSRIKRGNWIKFSGKAGIDAYKDSHIAETTLYGLELLGRSESTRYFLRNNPKTIRELSVDDWAPENSITSGSSTARLA
ncbi:hypothetical protein PGTUg99_006550 [Puccinia graminis f. sp. tritici]|uniref:Uncharacterized protein n=1 Tax=Puccinia graminis f. sp. tritici TaxID=56615 RepID=A0A5B0QUX7_PUCGR|nr:hypothetical protein PGTUg99_008660 [Puccinia graminis f. sp. tritici]KAA1132273.1 hypothetical protein PGTUg99_006550 [Puccinia graminis f. sp. tritici]